MIDYIYIIKYHESPCRTKASKMDTAPKVPIFQGLYVIGQGYYGVQPMIINPNSSLQNLTQKQPGMVEYSWYPQFQMGTMTDS